MYNHQTENKMKKNIFYTMMVAVAMFALTSCDNDKDSEGLSSIIDYPALIIQGDEFFISPIGQPYNDEGCTATYQGKDYTDKIVVTGLEDVDINTAGLYYVTYTATSPDGYVWSETRTVAVCDPAVTTDLSGTWTTDANTYRQSGAATKPYAGCTATIKRLCPGVFTINDYLAGYYSQAVGYAAAYPDLDFDVEGIFQLTTDNKIKYISGGPAAAFGSDLPEDFQDGQYDPLTGTLSYVVTWSGMDFHVSMKK